jgi:hypothetical protein
MKRAVKTFLFGLAVLIGVLLLGTFTGLIHGGNLGGYIFLGFLGLIVACQVIPALMLFGVLVKEIVHPAPKENREAQLPGGEGH